MIGEIISKIIDWFIAETTFIVALLGVLAGLYLGRFQRFVSERRWEKKAAAYEKIVEALSDLYEYNLTYYEHYVTHANVSALPPGERKELQDKYRIAKDRINNSANVGALLISRKAVKMLNDYRYAPRPNSNDPNWDIETLAQVEYDLIEPLMRSFLVEAKLDLKVDNPMVRVITQIKRRTSKNK